MSRDIVKREKVTVLFLAAHPVTTARLAIDEEMREIMQKVRASKYRDVLEFRTFWAARPDDVLQQLNEHQPQVVHYSGHGSAHGLYFVGADGLPHPIPAVVLKRVFATMKGNIRVIILNACSSREQAQALVEVIDCVIGMKEEIHDVAAATFASSFYRAIGFGSSIQKAFDQGIAALLLEGIPEESIPELLVKEGVDATKIALIPSERGEDIATNSTIGQSSLAISSVDSAFNQPSPPFDEGQLPPPEYFVGRRDDLEWVMHRMHEGRSASITVLNGLGGIGKTALSAVVVHSLRKEGVFPDGIAIIFCNGLVDAIDVLRRVLARFDPQRRVQATKNPATLFDVASRLLQGKKVLIVLDNVEPGLDIGKVVAPLKSVGGTLLLTSRHALPHAVVPVEASRPLKLLSSEDALELFVRSLGHRSVEDLSVRDREAVRRIVKVLDRHTLAVRLSGASAADLGLDLRTLAHDLEQDPLDVPEGEAPRAVVLAFSQSTEALPPDAQRLFVALAAFATPAFSRKSTLALAKGLGLAAPKQSVDLLVLRALVGASVDENMPLESDRERFQLHPLLRAFAAENFQLWTDEQRDRASHTVALYYIAHFNKATDRGLNVDEANIVGALEWAHGHAQHELVVTLCLGMQSFWLYRWRMSASQVFLPWGVAAAKTLAEQTGERDDRLRAADLALTYSQMLRYTGRVDEAEKELEQNLAVRQEIEDRRGEAEVLSALGQLYRRSGRTGLAEQYFLKALTILQEVPNRRSEGLVRLRLARVARRQGRQEEARCYMDQALEIDRETQNFREQALALAVSGQYAHDHGQLVEAERLFMQALTLAQDVKDPLGESVTLNSLGRLAQYCGRMNAVESFYKQSFKIVRETQNRLGESVLMALWGQLKQARGELMLAQKDYEQSLVIAREVHDRRSEGIAVLCIGYLVQARGEIKRAWIFYKQSLNVAREVLDRRIEGVDLSLLGQLTQMQGKIDEARKYYGQSLAIAREVHDEISEGRILSFLGTLVKVEGKMGEAEGYYKQSLAIARNVHDRRNEGLALFYLGQLPQIDTETTEGYFRQALDLLREQDMIQYTKAACAFGAFLIQQGNRPKDGCKLLAEATDLFTWMKLPGAEEAGALMRQLGCR